MTETRSKLHKIKRQDRREDTWSERKVRNNLERIGKDRKQDIAIAITIATLGLLLAIFGNNEIKRYAGIGFMYISTWLCKLA